MDLIYWLVHSSSRSGEDDLVKGAGWGGGIVILASWEQQIILKMWCNIQVTIYRLQDATSLATANVQRSVEEKERDDAELIRDKWT